MFTILDGRTEFFQWDLDQRLIIADPAVNEVHFCNGTDDCALVCEVFEENGQRLVNVPNIILQSSFDIRAYAYCNDSYTKVEKRFKVKQRNRPADYVYTETEVKTWEKLESDINAAISTYEHLGEELELAVTEAAAATEKAVEATTEAKEATNSANEAANEANLATAALKDNIGIFSNAVKGNESGEGAVVLRDVSPIEHNIKVSVSDNLVKVLENFSTEIVENGYYTVTAVRGVYIELNGGNYTNDYYEGAKVGDIVYAEVESGGMGIALYLKTTPTITKYGKNFVDIKNPSYILNATYEVDDDGVATFTRENLTSGTYVSRVYWECGKYDDFVGKSFTLSMNVVEKYISGPDILYVLGDFNTTTEKLITTTTCKGEGKLTVSFVVPENTGGWKTLGFRYYAQSLGNDANVGEYVKFKELQVEIGKTATEYEEYKEPITYETTDNIKSVYPTTTLLVEEGVTIEAEYNKDINKVIENLTQAIISMGGNV